MSDLIELLRDYRKAPNIGERIRLGNEIIKVVGPPMGMFVFGRLPETAKDLKRAAEDVTQAVLFSIAGSMDTFRGNSNEQFWKWCYSIARRRIADYVCKSKRDFLDSLPFDELWSLIDDSTDAQPLSAGDRIDLNYALRVLSESKPECRDYLWDYYVDGLDYADIAEEHSISYDNARMKIARCLEKAQSLI